MVPNGKREISDTIPWDLNPHPLDLITDALTADLHTRRDWEQTV